MEEEQYLNTEEHSSDEKEDFGDMRVLLHELVHYWYQTIRPLQPKSDGLIEEIWQNIWFAKGQKQVEVDNLLGRFASLLPIIAVHQLLKPQNITEQIGCIIACDQVSRNVYRGRPESFSYDFYSIGIAKSLYQDSKKFATLPRHYQFTIIICLCHSEDPDDQRIGKSN